MSDSRSTAIPSGGSSLFETLHHKLHTPTSAAEEPEIYTSNSSFNLQHFIEALPRDTPRGIFEKLAAAGYVGQEQPRRALSLLAFRHVQRLRAIYLDNVPVEQLPSKSNYLMIGPTGCGKTHLVELLFKHILKLPTLMVDITTYSETGYAGQDVNSILTRLLYHTQGNIPLAEIGVVCLDEFDKIASGQNNAAFAGAGNTKDISGFGVQRELLKLLESSSMTVPSSLSGNSHQKRVLFSTTHIPFIACGAFSGFKWLKQLFDADPRIGFLSEKEQRKEPEISVSYTHEETEHTKHFQRYGFLPELIARFSRIVPFQALAAETLQRILRENLLPAYQREFALAGVNFEVDDHVLEELVARAIRRETGARGLRSVLSHILEEVAYEVYSEPDLRHARLQWKEGQIQLERGG